MLAVSFAPSARAWSCQGVPTRIHDGDTITVRCNDRGLLKIRVANIDAPELHQAYGPESKAALERLSMRRHLQVDSVAVDPYQRVVATLAVDGRDLGLELVGRGLAWCGRRPAKACTTRQAAARQARIGLWADTDPLPPWQWRRQNPRRD